MGPLVGIQSNSGSPDPGVAVTRPDSGMTAGLHTVLAAAHLHTRTHTHTHTGLMAISQVNLR